MLDNEKKYKRRVEVLEINSEDVQALAAQITTLKSQLASKEVAKETGAHGTMMDKDKIEHNID